MESGSLTKVLYNFFTTEEGELSLSKGDFFLIQKIIDKHWCYGQSNNKFGKFPLNHLLKVDIPNISDSELLFISITPFRGEEPGDLSFNQGEIIIGNTEAASGWLTGHIGPRHGIFPASYTWQLDLSLLKKASEKKIVKRKAKVKTDLEAQLDEEISLIKGEILTVTEILDDGWCRGYTENGKEGIFPEAFIDYQETISSDEIDHNLPLYSSLDNISKISDLPIKAYKDFGQSYTSTNQTRYDDPAPNYDDVCSETTPKITVSQDYSTLNLKPYAITLFRFKAQFPNELTFESGQVVELIKYINNEWAEGIINNEKGIFPVSYVEVIVDCIESQENVVEDENFKVENKLQLNDCAKVEYKFDAQMAGDLSVSAGDIVTVVEITNNDWVTVKNEYSDSGLCPKSYLTAEFESSNEVFDDDLDDFVVIRNEKKDQIEKEIEKIKRLSEPHRPAPPAPSPGRISLQKQNDSVMPSNEENNVSSSIKQKKADQRQDVISEIYETEKNYIRDLKMTFETFNLHNPSILESKGIDVANLFGNIADIIKVAEELLELIQRAMKGCDEEYQTVGPCFLIMSDKMRIAYGKYCNNYEVSLTLLQKYKDNKEVMKIFEKGVETLQMQVPCFDMNSILIKPVQRILKYPILLNNLLMSTDEYHPDRPKIEEASKVMADVAKYINEYKRKKELASKYLYPNNTLIGKMANLNMHSVAKKSSRLSARLSATLGLTNLPTDTKFDELIKDFYSLEKSTKLFLKHVEACIFCLDDEVDCATILTNHLHQYFAGVPNTDILRFQEVRNIIKTRFLKDLKSCIEIRVILPLRDLITLLIGPDLLIQKRNDKMLDYDNAISRNENFKERGTMPEDLSIAKLNFEALNQQLIEELPVFTEASTVILYNCVGAFTNARKLYGAKIMKKYVIMSEITNIMPMDDIKTFLVYHNLLYNQIRSLNYSGTNTKIEKKSVECSLQTENKRENIKAMYPPNKLYIVKCSVLAETPHDLSAAKGTVVGLIKSQHPMGDKTKWLVDNGSTKGFIKSEYLEISHEAKLIEESANSTSLDNLTDLISLDSPVKEKKGCSEDLQPLYSNISNNNDAAPNYETMKVPEPAPRNLNKDIYEEFVYALFDYNQQTEYPGTLSIRKGQLLKVLKKYDQKKNPQWWLLEDRIGGKGYVPYNYVQKN